jgi:two-component system, OmpR family, sensor histidine kinase SenX3
MAACSALVVLFGALAVAQYRWSTRLAAADEQRERDHLESAASLFVTSFDGAIAEAVRFLRAQGPLALRSGERLPQLPRLIKEIYYFEVAKTDAVRRTVEDRFEAFTGS